MAPISKVRSAPLPTTQASKPAAAQQAQPATGYATSDSFQAPPPSTPARAITESKAQLDKFPASADRDAVANVLNKAWPSDKELKAANEALQRLGDQAPEGMSQEDFTKLSNGISYKSNQNLMMSMVTSNMQKQIEEIRQRGNSKD